MSRFGSNERLSGPAPGACDIGPISKGTSAIVGGDDGIYDSDERGKSNALESVLRTAVVTVK